MRARFIGAVAASAALIASTMVNGTASAVPLTWTITHGGPFNVTGGEMVLRADETGFDFVCFESSGAGTAPTGSNRSNPLATIGIQFTNCQWVFALSFVMEPVGDWTLNGVFYDGSGTTFATVDNFAVAVVSPQCDALIEGSLNVTYSNSTGELRVLPDVTLELTYVNPATDCLDLMHQGEHLSLSGVFDVDPTLTITSP